MRHSLYATIIVFVSGSAALLPDAARADEPAALGDVSLRVVDARSEEPLAGATLTVSGSDHEATTGAGGQASLEDLEPPSVIVRVELSGYAPSELSLEIEPGETKSAEARLSSATEVAGTVITVIGRKDSLRGLYHPDQEMAGDELQRSLASSVPATLEPLPGFAAQYNGPGAASPTLRGMPGDRVLMLEDGHRTGDIYWTAADHGVMVEPLSAERMEIIRGPGSLLYGSNPLGGVINIIRDDVPISRPHRLEANLASQFESVNSGIGSGAVIRGPAGPLSFYGEATGRRAADTRTPLGTLDETEMTAVNAATGLSWLPDWGLVGASGRYYQNNYGVPGQFDGALIQGAHPRGVGIETQRLSGRFRAAYHEPFAGFDGLEFRSNLTRYIHNEIEGTAGDEPIVGARFDQTTTDNHLIAHRDSAPVLDGAAELSGALGLSGQIRDLSAGGVSPGTRPGRELSGGGFAYGEATADPLRFVAGIRYDYDRVTTTDLDPLQVRTQERRIERDVEPRDFLGASASLATMWSFAEGWDLGASVSRSYRSPTIEELFSDGPHLADFSFDIGNPALDAELGLGTELFLRADRADLSLELAGFYNRVDGYIYYSPTGETVRVIREGERPRDTPVFEARGDDAAFVGAEGRIEWELVDRFVLDATASYTFAERRSEGDPLPFIPPLSGRIEGRYEGDSFFASFGTNFSAPQNRVPRPVEVGDITTDPQEPTDGYALWNAGAGYRHEGRRADHTVMLQARNVTDRVWRDHLSRVKDVAPQPGRNIQLTYRALF